MNRKWVLSALVLSSSAPVFAQSTSQSTLTTRENRLQFSGIYPHLAYFNTSGECGTGAVVPWANKLWLVTYSPHSPKGSSDKLYEIDSSLNIAARPESVGGTPANRMIHRESNQLFIGPYAIDAQGKVRVIPPSVMPGRHTATVRHLTDPQNKIYYATMEEGFYEVDVNSLAVKELYPDANSQKNHAGELLPGYHGKGAYSGQGVMVYANNGELSGEAQRRPDITSGVLAEWNGTDWKIVRRQQFTEVTGPGGIFGNNNPSRDPIWSIGWDHRSLILMLRQNGQWQQFRLPKASHSYDGAHGWNTEWPRIRDIGENDLLMTMHGTFWRFPKYFNTANTAGIRPRSTYLKVIGDFTRWQNNIVFGCDDTAQSEFLNKRKAKGNIAGPGQSHSNLWFVEPSRLDDLGAPLGRGAVWLNENVKAAQWSDPFLFSGYNRRMVHLSHRSSQPVTFDFEVDTNGRGQWRKLRSVAVPANGYVWTAFSPRENGEWVRVRANNDVSGASVFFNYANADKRSIQADKLFDGLAPSSSRNYSAGLVRARGENKGTLQLAGVNVQGDNREETGYYEIGPDMKLRRVDDVTAHQWMKEKVPIPQDVLSVDAASVLYIDEAGKRWRLPKGDAAFDDVIRRNEARIDREVVTERDLFNCHGTFYELPAGNAGGFAKIRPIATHNRRINDYCSWRGLLVFTGIDGGQNNSHIIRSDDGKAAIWVGAVDDLWKFGKARGVGGPCLNTPMKAGEASDPYLMTGYDRKTISLSHNSAASVNVRVEVDITGDGKWLPYGAFNVVPGTTLRHQFPDAFQAYWVRVVPDQECNLTAQLRYE